MHTRNMLVPISGRSFSFRSILFRAKSKAKSNKTLALSILLAASLSACSSSSDPTPQPDPPPQDDVLPIPQPDVDTVAPTADFSRTPNSGANPLIVQFTDNSLDGSSSITNWLWSFGDGQTSAEENPSHTYTAVGVFDVALTVTNSVGTNSKSDVGSVSVTQELPLSFVEGPSTIPAPAFFGDTLPAFSNERLIRETPLKEFNPVVNQLRFTSWNGTLGVNDCRPGDALAQLSAPAGLSAGPFSSTIPARSSADTLFDIYAGPFFGVPSPPTFPGRLLLIGKFNNPNDPTNNGKSFDLTGPRGVNGRWESCEERTPFLEDFFTSYVLSHPQKIQQVPRLRHYKVWKKLFQFSEPSGTSDGISRTVSESTGISETESQSFTASITATIGTTPPDGTGGPNVSLSATLSETFGQSVTLFSEKTITDTFPIDSSLFPEYQLVFSVWVEIDRYAIEGDTQGILWQDPNYVVPQGQLEFEAGSQTEFAVQRAWFLLP